MRRRANEGRGVEGLTWWGMPAWSRVVRTALPVVVLAGSLGCAPVPKPAVLADVEQARKSAVAKEARAQAPASVAHAEKLGRDADAAYEAGDTAGAQILGERALAAYAHASALARIARAEAAARESASQEAKAKAELAGIDADQARVLAEAEALELRLKVAVDAQPIVPSAAADPEREKARAAAARSLALQARLLCSAGRLLLENAPNKTSAAAAAPAPSTAQPPGAGAPAAPAAPGSSPPASASAAPPAAPPQSLATRLEEATAALAKLDADLAAGGPAPIDQASRARAGCLAALTSVRRAATPLAKAPGAGDALLAALSATGTWSPSRDDRGVTVTLRNLFKGEALTPAGSSRLAELGRIAAAHPTFPVVVVVHQDKEPPTKNKNDERAQTSRAALVVKALKAERAPRVEMVLAGAALPVVNPEGADRARNARVEVVFVTPETF